MAVKRENETMKDQYAKLAEVMDILRGVPEDQAIGILKQLRLTTTDAASLLSSIGYDGSITPARPLQALRHPPRQGGLEFELMVRHAIAYPTLVPLDVATGGIVFLHPPGLVGTSVTRFDV